MKKEVRNFAESLGINNRTISGYAIVFNKISEILSGKDGLYREIILPTAITKEKLDKCDIIFNFNHSIDYILARSTKGKGTLKYSIDPKGVKFEFECPNSYLGDYIMEALKRGDLNKCSFAFYCKKERLEKKQERVKLRYIEEMYNVNDMSIVTRPAYPQTSVTTGVKSRDANYFKNLERLAKEAGLDWQPGQQEKKLKEKMQKAYNDANMIIPNRWK